MQCYQRAILISVLAHTVALHNYMACEINTKIKTYLYGSMAC